MARYLPLNETNSVRPRDIAFYRETIQQEILPRVVVLDIITNPPVRGAIAYDTGTNLLYYGTGVAWIPLTIGGAAVTLTSLGGDESLVVNGVGPNLTIKGLSAGANISLVSSPTAVTIAYSGLLPSDVTLSDAGTIVGHASLVNDGVGPALAVKGFAVGPNMSLVETATDVTIDMALTTLSSAGGANTIVNTGVGPALVVKGFTAGPHISIGSAATELIVSFVGSTGDDVTLSDAGTILGHASLVNDGTGPSLAIKGVSVGSSMSLVETPTDITLDSITTTLTSAGGTTSLVSDGTGPALSIKGLTPGANVSFIDTPTSVTIDTPTITLTSAGGDISLVNDGTGPALATKGLTAGSNISISNEATQAMIAFTGSTGDDVTLSDAGTIGGHASLVNDGVGPALAVKGLSAGTNISITETPTDLTFDVPTTTLTSAGGVVTLVNDGTGPTLAVKGLTAGTHISISVEADQAQIDFTGTTGDDVTLTDAGVAVGHVSIVNDGVGPALAVTGLVGGTNVTLSSTGTDVTIDAATTTLTSAGGTVSLVNDGTGPALAIKGLTAGSHISISNAATDATIAFTGTTGDDVTLSDAGVVFGHQSLVVDGVGPTLSVVGLDDGEGMLLQTVGTDLVVNSEQYAYRTIGFVNSPYNIPTTNRDVGVHTLTGPVTINLPQIASLPLNQRKRYEITDADGNASVNFITINAFAGDFIGVPGGSPIVVNSDYATISLYSDTANTWYLY